MTDTKVHASRDFFNEISIETQQLHLITQYLETYVERTKAYGNQTGDARLLMLLDQLESFLWALKYSCKRLEKICENMSL